MNSRRSFLRFLGMSPIVGGSAVLAVGGQNDAPEPRKPKPQDGPYFSLGTTSQSYQLQLTADNEGQEHSNQVGMSVGKDNSLWLNINGTWRRVVVE